MPRPHFLPYAGLASRLALGGQQDISKKIAEVDISQAADITATILHAPRLTFERKFMLTRRMIARKRAALFTALQAG